ncbi:deoxycytidylate deaminase [Thalassotalea sp. G20_0]|nr:deoxycytidylate deaminase [Thalassotalea sp. G20_0]
MISNLFMERGKFVLIGLTGRTGSGCTTAANILESQNPNFPKVTEINYNGHEFYNGLNVNRYEILSSFSEEKFSPFYSIKVSDLISAYILLLGINEAVNFIEEASTTITSKIKIKKTDIKEKLEKGSFSKNYLNKKFDRLLRKLIHHENNDNLDKYELSKFLSFMRLTRKFTEDFKSELKELDNELYIRVYQSAGNSIRRIGKVQASYKNTDFNPESVFHLPETINRIIKVIRKIKDKAFIVIDAIRNPYEAKFFKERYAAFYLISINAPNEDRKTYLQHIHKLSVDDIDNLERRESGKTQIDNSDFVSQNVKRCIEISDVHLFNPRNEIDNHNILKSQLAWYFALMLHPGLVTPTSIERVMQIAYTAKSNSGCISRQVGAVVTDSDYSIKAIGWNDVAKGQVPCNLRSLNGLIYGFDEITYSQYERNDLKFRTEAKIQLAAIENQEALAGKNLSYCFKDMKNKIDDKGNQVHTRSLHAEENAFLQLSKYGSTGINGGKLFTTASPCELCAKKAYQLGIQDIVFIDPYPGIAIDHILSIGNRRPNLIQFSGAVGSGYHQLYEPIIAYKDELNYIGTFS